MGEHVPLSLLLAGAQTPLGAALEECVAGQDVPWVERARGSWDRGSHTHRDGL